VLRVTINIDTRLYKQYKNLQLLYHIKQTIADAIANVLAAGWLTLFAATKAINYLNNRQGTVE